MIQKLKISNKKIKINRLSINLSLMLLKLLDLANKDKILAINLIMMRNYFWHKWNLTKMIIQMIKI